MFSRLARARRSGLLALKVAPSVIPRGAERCALIVLFGHGHLRWVFRVGGAVFRGRGRAEIGCKDERLLSITPEVSCKATRRNSGTENKRPQYSLWVLFDERSVILHNYRSYRSPLLLAALHVLTE